MWHLFSPLLLYSEFTSLCSSWYEFSRYHFVSGAVAANGESSGNDDLSGQNNLPSQGADWVELFVREMMSASNMEDAKARASRVLEVLEKSICSRASTEAAQSFQQVWCLLIVSIHLIINLFSIIPLRILFSLKFVGVTLYLWFVLI